MKKILMTLAAVLCCAMTMTVFTACSENSDNPAPQPESEQLAEYTILYYAHGGGDLDKYALQMIADFYKANPDAYKKVNVVVQYKFSKPQNITELKYSFDAFSEDYGNKTIRWAIDPAKTFMEQASSQDNIYGADNADITCPDSLTNFINWAAKAYPAKKYMLIMNDHGRGYVPHDELPEITATRGMIYDIGNKGKHFTAKSFHRAVANANVRFETIYLLACLMNNLEYQFEIQDLCDYVIASTYTMPAWGGALYDLPEILSQPNVDIERALDAYCKADVASWDITYSVEEGYPEGYPFYSDLTVTRTANIAHLGEMMRQFTDRLCNTYSNGTERQKEIIDSCTAHTVKVQSEYPYYDVAKYMSSIIKALPEVYGDDFFNQMKETFNSCIVAQNYSKYLTVHDYMVDYSVMLGTGGNYSLIKQVFAKPFIEIEHCADGSLIQYSMIRSNDGTYYRGEPLEEDDKFWGSTLADTYEQLAFDRAVGWSRWLRLNHQLPDNLCPSDMHYELPMPE